MAVPQFARLPVFLIAGAAMAVLVAFGNRYGYHGDELYFIAAGRHLAWGYADQPPLLPLLALLMDSLFPDSVLGFRLPAVLFTGAGIVVAGRMIAYNWFDCDIQPQPEFINWAAGCVVPPR